MIGRPVAALVAQPDRLRRAREMAGLSIRQASNRLGVTWLHRMETGFEQPTDSLIRNMSEIYGVAVNWLCGADPVIPAETARVLRDANISSDERASLTELLGAIGQRPGITTCKECGCEVDLETCHCGTAVAAHNESDGHAPAPIGCYCRPSEGDPS